LTDPRVLALWSSLYGTMTTQRPAAVLFIFIYLIRRLLFAATAVFLHNYGLIQLLSLMTQSLCILGYLCKYMPFAYDGLNRLEIFNEVCIMIISYIAIMFTGYNYL
jgi:hypothetical protein